MASGDVAVSERVERWILDVAMPCLEARAARMEIAGAGWVQRTRHIPFEHDRLACPPPRWIGDRYGGEERAGVGMLRLLVQLDLRRELHHLAEVHDEHAVGDVA